jgi:hypothetical protein
MPRSLPPKPSLRYLKEEAKDLVKAHRRGDARCCRVLHSLRRFAESADAGILASEVRLHEAHFALALDYGFRNWDHLTRAVAQRGHVFEHMGYWDRFGAAEGFEDTNEGKVQQLLVDPEWLALAEMERQLLPLSEPCRAIRRQIANLERCHESYMTNVDGLVDMIGQMTPGRIRDCGAASEGRLAQAGAWASALDQWRGRASEGEGRLLEEARTRLGDPSDRKLELVGHLTSLLRDDRYRCYPVEEEDLTSVESRIKHLEICHYDWERNLHLLLDEICAGRQLHDWAAEGFATCGTCPERIGQISPMLRDVTGWIAGGGSGLWSRRLGDSAPEKRWLAACLCKHVTARHGDHDRAGILPPIRLPGSDV